MKNLMELARELKFSWPRWGRSYTPPPPPASPLVEMAHRYAVPPSPEAAPEVIHARRWTDRNWPQPTPSGIVRVPKAPPRRP
jgi:hypothetical protein